MLTESQRFKLHAGPYRPPRFKVGGTLDDRLRGPKRVIGISEAGWPRAHYGRKTCVVLTGDLIHAIHTESVQAVARAWGISCENVRRFRRALGVEIHNAGTRWLRRQYGRRLNDRRWKSATAMPVAYRRCDRPNPSTVLE